MHLQNQLGETIQGEDLLLAIQDSDPVPTIAVKAVRPGEHGGARRLLQRVGPQWVSNYRSVDYDPQGDPRWFMELVGTDAAKFFGFEMLAEDQLIIPDADEFMAALKKINKELEAMGEAPIAVNYYSTPESKTTRVADYVQKWGFENALPWADSGNHMLHDASFHTGVIFVPPSLVAMKAFMARYLNDFIHFLNQRYQHDAKKLKGLRYITYLWLMDESLSIDTATGALGPGIISSLRGNDEREAQIMLFRPLLFLALEGLAPMDYLAYKIKALDPSSSDYRRLYERFVKIEKLDPALEALPIQDLLQAKLDFDSSQPEYAKTSVLESKDDENADERNIRMAALFDKICQDIGRRRLKIREAALRLAKSQP